MDLDFDKIALSKSETKALNLLSKSNLLLDEGSKDELERLIRLDFAVRYPNPIDGKMRWGVAISDTGKDYLMYLCAVKTQKRTESIRYRITTGIAVAALILSLAALLWQAYTWNYELHREDGASFSSCNPDDSPSAEAPQELPE